MMKHSDIHANLVIGLKSGSHEDFNKLYEIYADLLYGFVMKLTKSPSESKDILQETFLRIWQTRERINLEMSFKAYIYTIARHLIMDLFREQVKSELFEDYICRSDFQQTSENEIERKLNFDEFKLALNQAKEKLTDRQKTVFELSRESGSSIEEIATQMHVSQQTVKNQLTTALKKLRIELIKYR